ncbi:hypothetical protein A1OE_1209 [Candidatus Endolissoclinum faulkneri L2]|uniref:Uncharacterized protein n=1 Tax=Candidatus Endolissoclinum faulkneri L2 TaxID=1193729 RepID=K7YIE7_9PROT|nr:hypothetical protein A1OE_1209 [Candidatus Endolissoclinum faulkneri L2]
MLRYQIISNKSICNHHLGRINYRKKELLINLYKANSILDLSKQIYKA